MLTIDSLRAYGADVQEGLRRCSNMESFYLRLVKMVPADQNFEKLKAAITDGDLEKGFEAAHALKGVLANLAITPILEPVKEITDKLRYQTDMDYSSLLAEIDEKYNELKTLCMD